MSSELRTVREGHDVTLVASADVVDEVLRASLILARDGISARVLSASTLGPLEVSALSTAALETGGVITFEKRNASNKLGAAVAESLLAPENSPGFFIRFGTWCCSSPANQPHSGCRGMNGLDAISICKFVRICMDTAREWERINTL